jgi:xanthine dehydrogenase accessory factor
MNTTPMDAESQRLLARLPDWLPEGARPAVLVTVWAVQGSTPRNRGARLLCRGGRLLAGTIGGGHLEEEALREAAQCETAAAGGNDAEDATPTATEVREEADSSGSAARLCKYPLGTQLGQCCGGVVWLHYRLITPHDARALAEALAAAVHADGPLTTQFDDETLREQPQPLTTALILGAGHVGTALARVLQPLPWRVLVVDHRPEWADRARFPPGVEVVCTEPLRLLAAWGWLGTAAQGSQAAQRLTAQGKPLPIAPLPLATRAAIMTHDHALDRDLTEALLRLPESMQDPQQVLNFVGLIGSASKIAVTQQRLRQRGVTEDVLARLHAPIGLRLPDGGLLGNKQPGQIAISVAAQLLRQDEAAL